MLPHAAAAGLFLLILVQFYLPGQGFTALIKFGADEAPRYLPELRAMNFYAERDSHGYDAQYYAQIAMHPQLNHPALRDAVDSLPYRARRILFCWTAYGLGLGQPEWVLHVFAVQNILCWLVLGWVLLRWFPPHGPQNFLRWFAVMFSFGLVVSVRDSLMDGPSLLLIALGVLLLEAGRTWWSALLLGVAGLGKETNLIAGAAFAPDNWLDRAAWRGAVMRGLLVVAPLFLWLLFLQVRLGAAGDLGARNFDWPFFGYLGKWRETLQPFLGEGSREIGRGNACVMIALTVQWLFFALRPRWQSVWWRIGAGYAALLVVLGEAVWEGYLGASPRVLLPMTLAFNLTVPRTWRWWPVLLLGNLLVWPSVDTMSSPPGTVDTRINGPRLLRVTEDGRELAAQFDAGEWYPHERSYFDYWRWSRGPAHVVVQNPHPYPVFADVSLRLKSSDERHVTLRAGERTLWSGPTAQPVELAFPNVRLEPGDNVWFFDTDRPPAAPPNGDTRLIAFRVCDLVIKLTGPLPPPGQVAPRP
ncbi:hypothetical protein DB354_05485 [Opitutus sp. ER46]|nr:hypothetical protein DB354_05485 [Opitutus sp. ER46]